MITVNLWTLQSIKTVNSQQIRQPIQTSAALLTAQNYCLRLNFVKHVASIIFHFTLCIHWHTSQTHVKINITSRFNTWYREHTVWQDTNWVKDRCSAISHKPQWKMAMTNTALSKAVLPHLWREPLNLLPWRLDTISAFFMLCFAAIIRTSLH